MEVLLYFFSLSTLLSSLNYRYKAISANISSSLAYNNKWPTVNDIHRYGVSQLV